VGPTRQPALLLTPGPTRQGSSSSWRTCRPQRASSRHRFLPTPSGPKLHSPLVSSSLLRSLPSSESGPPLKQAARIAPPPLPLSSNQLVVLAPSQALIERLIAARTEHVAPRATAEPQSPHRPHHRAEPAEPCWPVITVSPHAFVYTGAASCHREHAPCCRSPPRHPPHLR
jgi:hypothetical protein